MSYSTQSSKRTDGGTTPRGRGSHRAHSPHEPVRPAGRAEQSAVGGVDQHRGVQQRVVGRQRRARSHPEPTARGATGTRAPPSPDRSRAPRAGRPAGVPCRARARARAGPPSPRGRRASGTAGMGSWCASPPCWVVKLAVSVRMTAPDCSATTWRSAKLKPSRTRVTLQVTGIRAARRERSRGAASAAAPPRRCGPPPPAPAPPASRRTRAPRRVPRGPGSNPRRAARGRAVAAASRPASRLTRRPAKRRDHVLAEQLDRAHHLVGRDVVRVASGRAAGRSRRRGSGARARCSAAGSPTMTAPISSSMSKVRCDVSRSRSTCAYS